MNEENKDINAEEEKVESVEKKDKVEENVVESYSDSNIVSENKKTSPKPFPTKIIALLSVAVVVVVAIAIFALGGRFTHTHEFGEWTEIKSSTCAIEGINERMCSCGEKQTQSIAKKDHSYSEWIVVQNATCVKTGVKQSECTKCGETLTQSVPMVDHKYGEWTTTTSPTCENAGVSESVCSVCNDQKTKTISPTGHSYGLWNVTVAATCKNSGKKERTCECGKKESAVIPINDNHSIISLPYVAPTCTKTGLTEGKKCSVCDKIILSQDTIPITSHNLSETITKHATSTSQGTKTTSCSNCSYSTTASYSAEILSSEKIYEIAELCVGEIVVYNKSGKAISLGTVYVYSSNGELLTNYHVIDGAYSAKVTLNNVTYTVSSVLAYDKDIDLAVLKVNASNLYVPLIQSEGIKGGAKVYAVGSSEGYTLSFSTGVIASPSRIINGVEYIQHEAAISHGNSGGPLFNEYGEVIGINTLSNIDGQNLNFAISCKEISNLSFNSSLTMEEFYEKECDVFQRLKNYIVENGTYFSGSNYYRVILGNTYSADYSTKYTRCAYYYVESDDITLDLLIDDGDYWVYFTIDDTVDGSYDWKYFDESQYEMRGVLYASTYDNDTLLGYSYNNISYSSLRTTIRELASSMVSILCSYVTHDFSSIGVTADDLHFYYYS